MNCLIVINNKIHINKIQQKNQTQKQGITTIAAAAS
jgi:hypothetical protein